MVTGSRYNKKCWKTHSEIVQTPEQCDVKLLGTIIHVYTKEHTTFKSADQPNRVIIYYVHTLIPVF